MIDRGVCVRATIGTRDEIRCRTCDGYVNVGECRVLCRVSMSRLSGSSKTRIPLYHLVVHSDEYRANIYYVIQHTRARTHAHVCVGEQPTFRRVLLAESDVLLDAGRKPRNSQNCLNILSTLLISTSLLPFACRIVFLRHSLNRRD